MTARVALIGITGYGDVHYQNLLQMHRQKQLDLVAAVVKNPEQCPDKLAELRALKVEVYPDSHAMYKKWCGNLDLVSLPTGIASHEFLSIEALQNQANVLLEKPLTSTVASAQKIIDRTRQSGRFLAVAFQHVYHPEIQHLKQVLESGALGKICQGKVIGLWPRNDQYYQRNNWAGKRQLPDSTAVNDSPFANALAHYFNLLLFWCGDAGITVDKLKLNQAKLARARTDIDNFDTCAAEFQIGTIPLRVFFSHATSQTLNPRVELQCTNGRIVWQSDSEWQIYQHQTLLEHGMSQISVRPMFEKVIARINNPETFIYPPEAALLHVKAVAQLAALPIVQVPAGQISVSPDGTAAIDGLYDAFCAAYQANESPIDSLLDF